MNNAARDLRSQADRVDMALAKRVACTDEVRIRLENELKKASSYRNSGQFIKCDNKDIRYTQPLINTV